MTAHGSKGLEFDEVYIVHSNHGVWDNKRTPKTFHLPIYKEEDEDEQVIPEEPAPEAPSEGLMAMPEAGGVAPEEEQTAMLGGVDEEEPEDEL